jgi:cyanate permease
MLLLVGAAALAAAIVRAPEQARMRFQLVLALWALVSYVVITAWLPQNWDRYYLPLTPINALLRAYGTIWLLTGCAVLFRRVRGPRLRPGF